MRKTAKIPRIIKLNKVDGFKVYCAFNTGEHRIIDFEKLFKDLDFKSTDSLRSQLLKESEFNQVELSEGTLRWPNVKQKLKLSNGLEFEVAFDLDPIVLYDSSEADEERNRRYQIGQIIKKARKEAGLTQEELAKRSGTTKNYISRIENDKSDIELGTLRKIIEIGLDKRLNIGVN